MKRLVLSQKVLAAAVLVGFAATASAEPFITEIADPNNDLTARYIEIYNPGPGSIDLTAGDYQLTRWTNANTDPTASSNIALTGTMAAGTFLVIAADKTAFDVIYSPAVADVDGGTGGPADSNGDDNIALIKGGALPPDASGTIVDLFGVPGEDGTGTTHEFEDGRAERAATVTAANATWTASEWNIDNDSGGGSGPQDAPGGFDPGDWIGLSGVPDGVIVSAYATGGSDIVVNFDNDPGAVTGGDFTLTINSVDESSNITGISGTGTTRTLATSLSLSAGDSTIDNVAVADVATADPSNVDFYAYPPISLIQDGTITGGSVSVIAQVTATNGSSNHWIQDATGALNGINVYDPSNTYTVGNDVEVVGAPAEYSGSSQIGASAIIDLGATSLTVNPVSVAAADFDYSTASDADPAEQYEGVLITITGLVGPASNPDDPSEFGDRLLGAVQIGSTLYVDAATDIDLVTGSDSADVTGIGGYAFGDYEVYPRDAGDIVINTSVSDWMILH